MKSIAIAVLMFIATTVGAQTTAKDYKLTEVQQLKLTVAVQKAQLAQKDYNAAFAALQQALNEMNAEAAQVRVENKWAPETIFDPQTVSFREPPKKEQVKKP